MAKKWLYIVSLLLVITVSSFFLPKLLRLLLDNDTKNSFVLSYAKTLKLDEYFQHQRRNNPLGSFIWIKATTSLIDKRPIYTIELADFYLSINEPDKAIFWYQQAINKGFDNVRPNLAQLFFTQKKYLEAKAILSSRVNYLDERDSEKSLIILIKIALIEGELAQLQSLRLLLESINFSHPLLTELTHFKVYSQTPINKAVSSNISLHHIDGTLATVTKEESNKDCIASIQFFATNLAELRYTKQLINQVKSLPLSKYSCFESVRYIPLNELECIHAKDEAITCNEAIWQAYKNEIDSRFIAVMVPKGGAKVHNGILYLDSEDTVDVFTHELAHLFGFIDEYSLPINHSRCSRAQKSAFAQNIAVLKKEYSGEQSEVRNKVLAQLAWRTFIKDETPILTEREGKWLLGTPNKYKSEVGLFLSDTCQKITSTKTVNFQAFKPIAKRTSLHYFELDFPLLYQRLLEKDTKGFLMPSFHRNIEKAHNQ